MKPKKESIIPKPIIAQFKVGDVYNQKNQPDHAGRIIYINPNSKDKFPIKFMFLAEEQNFELASFSFDMFKEHYETIIR